MVRSAAGGDGGALVEGLEPIVRGIGRVGVCGRLFQTLDGKAGGAEGVEPVADGPGAAGDGVAFALGLLAHVVDRVEVTGQETAPGLGAIVLIHAHPLAVVDGVDGGEHEPTAGPQPARHAGNLLKGVVQKLKGVRTRHQVKGGLGRIKVLDGAPLKGDVQPGLFGVGTGVGELPLGDVDGRAAKSLPGEPEGVLPLAATQLQRLHARP